MVTLFLAGDVMTGRGVDQVLGRPGDARLREPFCHDAREYVALAERANGPIPLPVNGAWLWGDALDLLDAADPDARVVNLETAVTAHGEFAAGKEIHYRMNPANVGCLTVARPDVCVLSNNHVLDFGRRGLADTLDTLAGAGLGTAGAGRDEAQARRPAIVPLAGGGRVVVYAGGMASSGIGPGWAAEAARPGVAYLPTPSSAAAADLAERVRAARRPGDIVIVSLHWGPNWGYQVGQDEVRFAHALIDAGADLVHGHSSHHPRPIEVYQGKLILYGCGDFIDDYEGIGGYEEYRGDLRLACFATVDPDIGTLADLRIVALEARRMRLRRASRSDAEWLAARLTDVSGQFHTTVGLARDGALTLRPGPDPPATPAP